MATKAPARTTDVRNDRRPTVAELRDRARDALAEPEGVDFGALSRADRDKLMSEMFGL